MAAARPDGTGRAFSAVLRDLEGRSAWLTFLFSVPGKKGARWKFFFARKAADRRSDAFVARR